MYVGFRAHVKIASRIVSYRIFKFLSVTGIDRLEKQWVWGNRLEYAMAMLSS